MNRRGFLGGLLSGAAILPASTRTIFDMGRRTSKLLYMQQWVQGPDLVNIEVGDAWEWGSSTPGEIVTVTAINRSPTVYGGVVTLRGWLP